MTEELPPEPAPAPGTPPASHAALTAPIEAKTWAATAAGLILGLLTAGLNAAASNPPLLDGLPAWLRFIVITAVGVAVPGGAAYAAPHTIRTDPAALQGRVGQ